MGLAVPEGEERRGEARVRPAGVLSHLEVVPAADDVHAWAV